MPGTLATGALVIEDLHENACEDAALFHLINLAREQGDYLLITARTPPERLEQVPGCAISASRLRALRS